MEDLYIALGIARRKYNEAMRSYKYYRESNNIEKMNASACKLNKARKDMREILKLMHEEL